MAYVCGTNLRGAAMFSSNTWAAATTGRNLRGRHNAPRMLPSL